MNEAKGDREERQKAEGRTSDSRQLEEKEQEKRFNAEETEGGAEDAEKKEEDGSRGWTRIGRRQRLEAEENLEEEPKSPHARLLRAGKTGVWGTR